MTDIFFLFTSGVAKSAFTFFISTAFAIVGSLFILIGASIWTVMIHKAQSVNGVMIGNRTNPIFVGIKASTGDALYMIWAAFVCLLVSVVPYMVRYVAAPLFPIVKNVESPADIFLQLLYLSRIVTGTERWSSAAYRRRVSGLD
jgi:hypothetical protein